jgi:hypothetical protein
VRTFIAIVALLAASEASAAPPHLSDGMLVDEHGMTLYAYAGKGTPDATACEGACELNFPSAIADQQDTPNGSLTLVNTQTANASGLIKAIRCITAEWIKRRATIKPMGSTACGTRCDRSRTNIAGDESSVSRSG